MRTCRNLRDVRRSTGHALFRGPIRKRIVDWQGSRALLRSMALASGRWSAKTPASSSVLPVLAWSVLDAPFRPAGENRLAPGARQWFYASEAAWTPLVAGFDHLVLSEVVSFYRSQQLAIAEVMQAIGACITIRPMTSIIQGWPSIIPCVTTCCAHQHRRSAANLAWITGHRTHTMTPMLAPAETESTDAARAVRRALHNLELAKCWMIW